MLVHSPQSLHLGKAPALQFGELELVRGDDQPLIVALPHIQ